MSHRHHIAAFSASLAFAACPPIFDDASLVTTALGPIAAGDHVILADAAASAIVSVALEDGRIASRRRVPLAHPPSLLVAAPDGTALALSREGRTLDLLDPRTGAHRTLDLGSPFEGLALSPDSDVALAYYPPNTASAIFHNENEVAHIDLDPATPSDRAVSRRTLASLGGAPDLIAISPKVSLRRYAFVLSDSHVAILNLADPTMVERSVPLVSLNSSEARTPTAVDFGVSGDTLWAIVSTAEASSVYALAITKTTPDANVATDFDVRLSQLPGTSPGGAAALVSLEGAPLHTLTTSPARGTVTLTDVTTATGVTLDIAPGLNRLVLFEGETGPAALTWATSNPSTFHVIDLPAMAAREDKAFRTRTTRATFSKVVPIPRSSRFLAINTIFDQGVSVIDADTDRVTGFGRTGSVKDISIFENLDRAYILTSVDYQTFLVGIDLESLHPEIAEIRDGADRIAVMPNANTVAAISQVAGGLLTLWPLSDTSDGASLTVPGLLVDHLFDR